MIHILATIIVELLEVLAILIILFTTSSIIRAMFTQNYSKNEIKKIIRITLNSQGIQRSVIPDSVIDDSIAFYQKSKKGR